MSALAFPTRSATLSSAADAILKSSTPAKLDWKSVDVETMPDSLKRAYNAYKEAQRVASEARQLFEDEACSPIGRLLSIKPGQDVAFGYRFGQLSVALTDKRTAPSKANALRF